MSAQNVFLVFCELAASSRPLRAQGQAGAFVTCLVATSDISEAITRARRALNEDGYDIADIDKVLRYEPDEWAYDDEIALLARDVQQNQELRYSTFNVWGH